jgi:hypothetical protein
MSKEIPWEHDALKATIERGVMKDIDEFSRSVFK